MTTRFGPAGPGRAAVLALSSWLRPLKGPHSARTNEVNFIKNKLARTSWDQEYLAVTGPKGVGKTCLIDTALTRTAGVVRVTVNPGTTPEIVELNVMRAVTSANRRTDDLAPSFRRVVFWHRVLTLGKSPIVVLSLDERGPKNEFAKIAGVVREPRVVV